MTTDNSSLPKASGISKSEPGSCIAKQRKKRKWDQPSESLIASGFVVPVTLPLVGNIVGETQKSLHELIAREIVINDAEPTVRYRLTKRQTQEEIQRSTGAVVITRGKYCPSNELMTDNEKPLYLHISAGAHLKDTIERVKAVDRAASIVDGILKQGQHATLNTGLAAQPLSTCIFLGFEPDPSLNIAERIRGPNDKYISHIINVTGASVVLRGKGLECPGTVVSDEQPLHLYLSSNNARSLDEARILARTLPSRVAALLKVLVPSVFNKQGAQLFAVSLLVVSRTIISDRIASLNGTSVKFVLEQDRGAFARLIGISVIQSAASSFVAPSLRFLTGTLALGWRIRLTEHLLKNYLKRNAFYKIFHLADKDIDADQRVSHDVDKLTNDLSGLVTGLVKPSVDIIWFTWRMKSLTGKSGVAILYAYMLLGLGFLRSVTPDYGDLASREQQLEGSFRFVHSRLREHAESIAFFGGGYREKTTVDVRFRELLDHSNGLLKKKWLFGILDDFITKQLPHNVTWGLSYLYATEHKGDRALTSTQGHLAHALRFLASVVSQSFLAFGDILELHKKYVELTGGINRILELEELLEGAHYDRVSNASLSSQVNGFPNQDIISFFKVDIISPSQKLLVKNLTCDIRQGKSLLVTGPNGSGKSSVFRILRGLWPTLNGRLVKPDHYIGDSAGAEGAVFYVPQRPYTSLGTLRDQIIYPLSLEEAKLKVLKLSGYGSMPDAARLLDSNLKSILENVRLIYLMERDDQGMDATLNWEDILSLGEQQRLGMARLFFHRPKFGILDECTNATSVDVEEQLYKLATDMGITVVTSSQRPALIPFHSMELCLIDGEGKWELSLINH